MIVRVERIRKDAVVPQRASNQAVGYDVWASIVLDKNTKKPIQELPVKIEPGKSALIGIGVCFAVPFPIQCEVRPRSGLASKYDIELSNSPGTVDPDFRGEIGILLRNRGDKSFTVKKEMRVAQLIFSKVTIPVLEKTKELPKTLRGAGGFGSTGLFEIREGTEIYQKQIEEMDRFYMRIVLAVAARSNCVRGVKRINGKYERDKKGSFVGQTRRFGCVIVQGDNIISMGFNAQYKGSPFCSEVGCLREAENIPSGTKIERCRAIHAEMMAMTKMLVSGVGTSTQGATMYVNTEPCEICAKLIVMMGVDTLAILKGVYPTNGMKIIREGGVNIRYVEMID